MAEIPAPSIGDVADEHIHVEFDGRELLPVVYKAEASGSAKMTEYTDQCGRTESDKLGPGTMTLTINAILYKNQVQDFYRAYEQGDAISVTHPAEIGTFTLNIRDVAINMEGENNTFMDKDNNERDVFDCQFQLKSPNARTE